MQNVDVALTSEMYNVLLYNAVEIDILALYLQIFWNPFSSFPFVNILLTDYQTLLPFIYCFFIITNCLHPITCFS